MNIEGWNYEVFKQFYTKIYKECLTQEHLLSNGAEEFYDEVYMIKDGLLCPVAFEHVHQRTIVKLEKGNTKYLLPSIYADKLPIRVKRTTPYQLKKSDKRVWHFIEAFDEMNIPPVKSQTFREFIDTWNPVENTHPDHAKLLKLIAIASKWKGLKICVCSRPNSGKTSNFTLMRYLSDDVARITDPTIAKWESLMYLNKVILPDELPTWKQATVREIENPVISVGDGSTEYNKRSKAMNKFMERMDASQLSLIFTYNRPQDMKKGENFFDDCWNNPGAFKSRYPQLLLDGEVTSKMKHLSPSEAISLLNTYFDEIRVIAKNYSYFTSSLDKEMHHYDRTILSGLSNRHAINLQSLFDAIDVYCQSQQEFDAMCLFVLNSMTQYKLMAEQRESYIEEKQAVSKVDSAQYTLKVEEIDMSKQPLTKTIETIDKEIL